MTSEASAKSMGRLVYFFIKTMMRGTCCGVKSKIVEVLPNNFSVYFQYLSAASIKTALFINRLGLIFLNQPPFP